VSSVAEELKAAKNPLEEPSMRHIASLIRNLQSALTLPLLRHRSRSFNKPQHAAFILDGSRRFARREKLASARDGHELGARRFNELIELCHAHGIPNLSVYAFSLENFKRSAQEIAAILDILKNTLDEMLKPEHAVNRLGCRVCIIGARDLVPEPVRIAIERAEAHTRQNRALTIFLSVAYDGREEIVRAARLCAAEPNAITMDGIAHNTYLRGHLPGVSPVDFMVRTGDCRRLSSFLLWDASHAEIYFTAVLWPDFDEYQFLRALASFNRRTASSQAIPFHYWSAENKAALPAH
jgi:tritrans,polycis-undecaprenyl-diphosphate synthase [geranylgeranyl-diphosphate specific]